MKRKRIIQSIVAIIICMMVIANPVMLHAVDTSDVTMDTTEEESQSIIVDPEVGTDENGADVAEVPTELTIELNQSIQGYIQQQDAQYAYDSIRTLTITTQDEYQLTLDDLSVVQTVFVGLEQLDVKGATFQTEESYNSWRESFEGKEGIEYSYTENSFMHVDEGVVETPDNKDEAIEGEVTKDEENKDDDNESSDIKPNEEKGSYTTKLKDIYILDKGSKLDMGMVYESTDPNIEFQWMQYDLSTKQWSYISGMSKSNWTTWSPKKTGNYWIYVQARTSDGKMETFTLAYTWKGITTQLTGIYIPNQGAKYDMGICYTSNDPSLQFQWKLYDLKKQQWSIIQSKSKSNWATWLPKTEGHYWIHVEAFDSLGGVTTYTMQVYFGGLKTQLNGISVVERKSYVDMGMAYTSNDPGLKFRWLLYDVSAKKWTHQISDWSTGNWASWKPQKTGEYWFWGEVKTSTGEVKAMSYVYRVSNARITSFTANQDTPYWVGKEIKLKGQYWDYKGEVGSERILLWDGKTWSEMPSAKGEAVWMPKAVGNYLLCYEIYNTNGGLIQQSFKAYNIEKPYVNLNGIYVRYDGNKSYSMAVNYRSNDRNLKFRWLYYDADRGIWNQILDWNSSNATSWKPPREGNYWLHVEAKTHDGAVTSQTIVYQVNYVTLLGQFSTISTNDFNGTFNMMKAIQTFNNRVLMPGQTMSFSNISGPWGPLQGYKIAGVVGGVGFGGGVCQASTTLYGAIVRAGLTIVERQNHSVPSTYVPIGLDAMVSWGTSDLQFRNDFSYPVTIKTMATGNVLIAQVYGQSPGWYDSIEPHSWRTGSRSASAERVYYKNGQVVHRQSLPNSYY